MTSENAVAHSLDHGLATVRFLDLGALSTSELDCAAVDDSIGTSLRSEAAGAASPQHSVKITRRLRGCATCVRLAQPAEPDPCTNCDQRIQSEWHWTATTDARYLRGLAA